MGTRELFNTELETKFSDSEYCLMSWDALKKEYVVIYNVIGVSYIIRCGRLCNTPKRYFFCKMEDAARLYRRLCKYRPLFVA